MEEEKTKMTRKKLPNENVRRREQDPCAEQQKASE